jgi:hypothetical protein
MVNTTIVGSTEARGTAVLSCASVRPKAAVTAPFMVATLSSAAVTAAVAKAAAVPAYVGSRHGGGLAFTTLALTARTAVMSEQTTRIDDVQGNRPRGPAPV